MAKSQHTLYMESSPYYAQVFERFGPRLDERTAQRIAGDHGLTLGGLRDSGDLEAARKDGSVQTLALIAALGY